MDIYNAYINQNGSNTFLGYINKEQIPHFIMQYGLQGDLLITDTLDQHFIDTFGYFVNRASDQEVYAQDILPTLIALQTGEQSPKPVVFLEENTDDSEE